MTEMLKNGSCEPLKASVHATALGLCAVMGAYNVAAWLMRREQHLAVNAVVYALLTAWEQRHVARHLETLRECRCQSVPLILGDGTADVNDLAA